MLLTSLTSLLDLPLEGEASNRFEIRARLTVHAKKKNKEQDNTLNT
jgi:hypothetical protein